MRKFEKIFYYPYLIVILVGFATVIMTDHGDSVIWFNKLHSEFPDFLFKYLTFLGDGIFLALTAIVLLAFRLRFGLILGLIGVVQAIISWFLKKIVFGKVPRPKNYFDDLSQFQLVEGEKLNGWYSFPSGHTMTAFSIAVFLMYYKKNPIWSALFFALACLAGISRIYLFQHFLVDVLVGSLIGVIISLFACKIFRGYLESKTGKQAS